MVSGGSSGTLEEEGSEAQPRTRILPGWLLTGHSDQVWICVGERETALIWPWGGPSLLVSVTWVWCLDVLAWFDLVSVLSISRWDFW